MSWLLVAVGGALGASARFLLDTAISRRLGDRWPWGTLAVNVLGSGLLGVVVGLDVGPGATSLLGAGFCGAFTTASAFGWQAVALVRGGGHRAAVAYVLASVVLSTAALAAGWGLAAT